MSCPSFNFWVRRIHAKEAKEFYRSSRDGTIWYIFEFLFKTIVTKVVNHIWRAYGLGKRSYFKSVHVWFARISLGITRTCQEDKHASMFAELSIRDRRISFQDFVGLVSLIWTAFCFNAFVTSLLLCSQLYNLFKNQIY